MLTLTLQSRRLQAKLLLIIIVGAAAAIVRSRACARTICIVLYVLGRAY